MSFEQIIWTAYILFMTLLLGVIFGIAVSKLIHNRIEPKKIKFSLITIFACSWIAYVLFIVWWQISVISRLGPTEGDGVDFGTILLYFGGLLLALLVSFICITVFIISRFQSFSKIKNII